MKIPLTQILTKVFPLEGRIKLRMIWLLLIAPENVMIRFAFIWMAVFFTGMAQAERIDNFVLLDQHGDAHNLYYHKDKSAIVVMIQGNGCPIVRNALSDYKALRDEYADQGVHFLMLNSNLQDQRSTILAEAEKYGIDMPILHDESQLVGESLNLVRTAEILVIDPTTWNIAYRGPINDRQVYERQKAQASNHYAADAIANVLAGEAIAVANRDTMGCLINFAQRNVDHAQISYTDTVAPLLQEKCVVCHTEGGIGPWAMSSYEMVRGFAPMMREVIRTKRMPPWHADPHIGALDRSRSTAWPRGRSAQEPYGLPSRMAAGRTGFDH
jgi:peroxiredoxin